MVRQNASGVVRIDARSGHVEWARMGEAPPEPELPETVVRLVRSGELRPPVWRRGAVVAAIHKRGDKEGRVILSRWDRETGQALPDIVLLAAGLGLHLPSADGRFFLATKLAEPAGPARARFIWIIFSLETGERVAEFRNDLPEAPFFVWRSTLVHVVPPGVRAIDLKTGAEVWSRPIRETRYRGPYPPSR